MIGPTFTFVINCSDSELPSYKKITDFSRSDLSRSDLGWCLQAYSILSKRKKIPVQISNHLVKGSINIVHSAQLYELLRNTSPAYFIVSVQADFPRRAWAQYHIVQNAAQILHETSMVPFWPQPKLISRNPVRKGVKTVAYAGQVFNGNLVSTEKEWKELFAVHGLDFITLSSGVWHDLSEVDVLIGIRSFDSNPHDSKPASKLINAWHANIPFIGGYDSAYMQIGVPGEDYLIAKTQQEAVDNVLKLRDDSNLYQKLVLNGKIKSIRYTNETIAARWEQILTGPATERYHLWQSRPLFEQFRFFGLVSLEMVKQRVKQMIRKPAPKEIPLPTILPGDNK